MLGRETLREESSTMISPALLPHSWSERGATISNRQRERVQEEQPRHRHSFFFIFLKNTNTHYLSCYRYIYHAHSGIIWMKVLLPLARVHRCHRTLCLCSNCPPVSRRSSIMMMMMMMMLIPKSTSQTWLWENPKWCLNPLNLTFMLKQCILVCIVIRVQVQM